MLLIRSLRLCSNSKRRMPRRKNAGDYSEDANNALIVRNFCHFCAHYVIRVSAEIREISSGNNRACTNPVRSYALIKRYR